MYNRKTTRRKNGARQNDGKNGTPAGKRKSATRRRRFPPHYEPTDKRAEVTKIREHGGRQDEIRESEKETKVRGGHSASTVLTKGRCRTEQGKEEEKTQKETTRKERGKRNLGGMPTEKKKEEH